MVLRRTKAFVVAGVCALAMVFFSSGHSALADSGSGSGGDTTNDSDGALIAVVINFNGDTTVMNEAELRQRCEQECECEECQGNNSQFCTLNANTCNATLNQSGGSGGSGSGQ